MFGYFPTSEIIFQICLVVRILCKIFIYAVLLSLIFSKKNFKKKFFFWFLSIYLEFKKKTARNLTQITYLHFPPQPIHMPITPLHLPHSHFPLTTLRTPTQTHTSHHYKTPHMHRPSLGRTTDSMTIHIIHHLHHSSHKTPQTEIHTSHFFLSLPPHSRYLCTHALTQ